MAALSAQQVILAGLTPSYVAAAGGGDTIQNNDGNLMIHVKNGGGGSINVTVTATGKLGGASLANQVIAVPNGAERMIGPFDPTAFNAADGSVGLAYSGVTSVTIAVIRVR